MSYSDIRNGAQLWEGDMLIAAMILGLVGGLLSLGVGILGGTIGAIVNSPALQFAAFGIPTLAIVGGAFVKVQPLLAGALLLASAGLTIVVFGYSFYNAAPLILTVIAGILALVGNGEATAGADK